MKKFCFILLYLPLLTIGQTITVTITLSGTPNYTTKVVPANLKFNKWGHFDFTQDDRGIGALDAAAYFTGGTAYSNGLSYPGLTFTDGAGNYIPYTGSVACNSWANADTLSDYSALGPTYMNWQQTDSMVKYGWNLLNHGGFHGIDQSGAVNLGFDAMKNIAANANNIFRQISNYGDQYVTRYGVVPSADSGYHSAWEQLGYIGGASQNAFDNYPADPIADWANNGLATVTNLKTDNRYHVRARRFKDMNASDAVSEYESYISTLISSSSPSANYSLSYFIHQWDFPHFRTIADYLNTNANDHIWVCGLQEFYEYFETIQQTGITQSISGNTLTVTLDQSYLPADQRWRDMTLLLNSNVSLTNVSVTGADDYSYNTSTGLINIYKKKTTGFSIPAYYNATGFVQGKVPLISKNLFIDNNYQNPPSPLIDGSTSTQYHARDFDGAMIYSPYDVTFDLTDYGVTVDSVRIYGSGASGFITKVLLTRNDNEGVDSLGIYTSGSGWITYKGRTASKRYVASRLILSSNSTGGYGNEVEVYGTYLPYTEQVYAHRPVPISQMLGTNAHWWNFVTNTTGDSATALVTAKINGFDSLHIHSIRNYGPANQYQNATGSQYAFNPVTQGWYEDLFMRKIKQDNPDLIRWSVLLGQTTAVNTTWNTEDASLQMQGTVVSYDDSQGWGVLTVSVTSSTGGGTSWSNWFVDLLSGSATDQTSPSGITIPSSYPANQTFVVGAGVNYHAGDIIKIRARHSSQLNFNYTGNNNTGRSTPSTWDSVGTLAYRWAARKGTNTNASSFTAYTNLSQPWLNNDNTIAKNTAEWTEVMNEPNAWWGGYDEYLNGQMLAAANSKIYDNNKVSSTSIGSKNADTSMKVSFSGLAISVTDLNRGVEFWSKQNRSNRAKTSVPTQPNYWRAKTFGWSDEPLDIIQFHNYSYTGGHLQYDNGGIKSGLPPELGVALSAVDEFVWFRNKYAPWASVDVGEWGYDVNQNSNMNAPNISIYDSSQVAGYWAIRTMLGYNVHGVDYSQWYRLFQDNAGDDFSDATQFGTMSILREDANTHAITLRKVGRYFRQLDEFGGFVYDSTLREDSIRVYRFKSDTNYLYAIWSVETSPNQGSWNAQKAIFVRRTGTYNLPLANGTHITIRNLQDYSLAMSSTPATVRGTSYFVDYDTKPVFIQVGTSRKNQRSNRILKK